MELGLSLGEASRPTFALAGKTSNKGLGFCMSLGVVNGFSNTSNNESSEENKADEERDVNGGTTTTRLEKSDEEDGKLERNPPVHELHLLPLDPVKTANSSQPVFPWPPPSSDHYGNSEAGSSGHLGLSARGFDVNRLPSADDADDGAAVSSPNSTVSSFQRDFSIYSGGSGGSKRDAEAAGLNEAEAERASSRASDEEENGLTRKKLRLSKEQSAFLEESFKEHNTLNPKQKLALAKQLNLRARQVEVWFQNRRARTKLKQTEVDCEYLKRCCETLTEENRRLQKELQELRALKTSHPYYTQLPATTLTMCPSCERTTTTKTSDAFSLNNNNKKQPRFYPFSQPHLHQSSAAS